MRTSRNYFALVITVFLLFMATSCYYDNEEYLYPGNGGIIGCDTTNVTYSGTVAPILATNCNNCHNPASPSGGVIVNNYSDLLVYVNNGRFWGSINHEQGYQPMPRNLPKLSECNLTKIKKWIDDGALDN
jgi:hypothetical protein